MTVPGTHTKIMHTGQALENDRGHMLADGPWLVSVPVPTCTPGCCCACTPTQQHSALLDTVKGIVGKELSQHLPLTDGEETGVRTNKG